MRINRKSSIALGLGIGIVVLGALFAWRGVETVAGLLAEAGFGLLIVCLVAVPDQIISSEAWRWLFPPASRPGFWRTLMASWMGHAVNTLLPVATIGGEIAKARVLALWSHPAAEAAATMTVDKTVQAVAVLLWGLVGAAFLAAVVEDRTAVLGILAGAGLLALGIAGFVAIQVKGGFSFLAGRFAAFTGGSAAAGLVDDAQSMERSIREVYGARGRLATATGLRLAGQVVLASEVVLAGHLMGVPISVLEAVILKGIVTAIRGMAFAVPGALGIQEGGFMAIGALIGQPPDLMIAVSLASRLREIVPSIPFLLLWQTTEGKAAWRGIRRGVEAEDESGGEA